MTFDATLRHATLLLFCTALCACGAGSGDTEPEDTRLAATECQIDRDARIPWADWRQEDDAPGTAVFAYEGCGKRLVFVAAEHGNDPESDTFEAVRTAIEDTPDLVLIEGVTAIRGENFQPLLDYAASVEGTPADNESMFSARLATANGIAVMGAEPEDREVLSYAERNGVGAVDLVGFYMLRQLPQMVRAEQIETVDGPGMETAVTQLAPYFADQIGLQAEEVESIDTLPEFQTWYAGFNDRPFDDVLSGRDSVPSSQLEDPAPSNFVSDVVADARDTFILDTIADALDDCDHVVIVYGGSHHTVQDPALRAAFGAPVQLR